MRFVTLPLLLGLAACHPHRSRWPDPPKPMTTPVALASLNSPFDDFNSADMSRFQRHTLVFSTNRGSQGHDFDLYEAELSWAWVDRAHPVTPTPFSTSEPKPFAPQLMSDANERGPIHFATSWSPDALVFASDRAGGLGGLDLYAVACNETSRGDVPCEHATDARALAALSSPGDDAYLSLPFADRQVLFASNRDGRAKMDIYRARWAAGATLVDPPAEIAKVAALSSEADDTAPFIYGLENDRPEVVFVSDRPGGLGEHDLYCSRYVAGAWTPPVALASLNSPRDEYRPIVIWINRTRFLIFSSTRDGGQGGYDLYLVGYEGCPR